MEVATIIPNAAVMIAKIAIVVLVFIYITIEKPIYMSCESAFICIFTPLYNILNSNIILANYERIFALHIVHNYDRDLVLKYLDVTNYRDDFRILKN